DRAGGRRSRCGLQDDVVELVASGYPAGWDDAGGVVFLEDDGTGARAVGEVSAGEDGSVEKAVGWAEIGWTAVGHALTLAFCPAGVLPVGSLKRASGSLAAHRERGRGCGDGGGEPQVDQVDRFAGGAVAVGPQVLLLEGLDQRGEVASDGDR